MLSSFTCQLGVFADRAHGKVGRTGSVANVRAWGMREWFILTYLMGAVSSRQVTEYAKLVHEGVTISNVAVWIGLLPDHGFLHGLHVTGGLIAFVFVLAGRTWLVSSPTNRPYPRSSCRTTGTSSLWSWIALFATHYLLK